MTNPKPKVYELPLGHKSYATSQKSHGHPKPNIFHTKPSVLRFNMK
jgi:hypothetical protein